MKSEQNKMGNIEKAIKKRNEQLENPLERCVLPDCGKILDIPKNTPISLRRYYIEGVGQLCEDCYKKIYGST